jgi:hypothetical protein
MTHFRRRVSLAAGIPSWTSNGGFTPYPEEFFVDHWKLVEDNFDTLRRSYS